MTRDFATVLEILAAAERDRGEFSPWLSLLLDQWEIERRSA